MNTSCVHSFLFILCGKNNEMRAKFLRFVYRAIIDSIRTFFKLKLTYLSYFFSFKVNSDSIKFWAFKCFFVFTLQTDKTMVIYCMSFSRLCVVSRSLIAVISCKINSEIPATRLILYNTNFEFQRADNTPQKYVFFSFIQHKI